MAAPSFVDAGTGATDAGGAWTYTCQASAAAGRVFIVQILQDGSTHPAVAVTGATNIEDIAGTDNAWTNIIGSGTTISAVGNPTVGYQHIYIGRALSTSAPTISGTNSTSEDLYIRSYQFSDVSTGTTIATVIENIGGVSDQLVGSRGTDGTITDAGVTTAGPDRLALNFVAINDDNVIAEFTGETGGDWKHVSDSPYAESSGTDGAIGLQYAYVWDVGAAYSPAAGLVDVYGSVGTNEEQAQSFPSGAGGTVASVSLALAKSGSPTDNLVVEIQTDNAGVPSGTVVGTSGSLSAASLPASPRWFSIPVSATLAASTTYHLVARRDGARDTVNRGQIYRVDSAYADGTASTRNSGTWSNNAFDIGFGISYGAATINGGTATNSDATDGWGVVGFALIGTTVVDTTYYPRHPAHDFGSVTNF